MRHNGHIRQRTHNSFEIRYSLGHDPVTGKWKVKTVTVKGSRKDAEKELRRILNTLENNSYVEPNKITTSDFLKQWIETVRSQVSPKTHERYSEIVRNFLIPTFGHHLLCKLTPTIIQIAYNSWETSGRKDNKYGGLAPRTRLHLHMILKSALKHAVQLSLIVRNPTDVVKAPRAKKASIKVLTIEQATTLLSALHASHPRLYWPVLIALTTGMRRGEILALRWQNVDFDTMTARVVESLEQVGQKLRFKAPKTEKNRAIILYEFVAKELKAWKEIQATELLEVGVTPSENGLVCGRWDGRPHKPDSLTGEFARAIAKIPTIPHKVPRFEALSCHAVNDSKNTPQNSPRKAGT